MTDASLRRICCLTVLPVMLIGCSQHTGAPVMPTAPPPEPAPAASTPVGVTQLFRWSWNNRDFDRYRTLFTADYRYAASSADTAGSAFRSMPWTRDDELIAVKDLFVSGNATGTSPSNVHVTFERAPTVTVDDRPGKTYPVHQRVETTVAFELTYPGGVVYRFDGLARFYVVRSDSAQIPADLNLPHDQGRWYIERWEDGTGLRGPHPR